MAEAKLIDGIRYYRCGNDWLPSVTSILRATSPGYRGGKASGTAQAAMNRGTAIHSFCEARLHGKRVARKVPDDLRPYWKSLQPSLRRLDHCQMTERFVWHREQRYAGTLDAVARYKGVLSLVDFKTTGNLGYLPSRMHEYSLQLVAYAHALHDTHGLAVEQAVLIVAHPDGAAQEHVLPAAAFPTLWAEWQRRCKAFPRAIAKGKEAKAQARAETLAAFQW